MNSLWLIITSLAAFAVAYRFYGAFLAAKVAALDDSRPTPAHRLKDGVDYHPTNKIVLFGHHFAAIAGPGPLIGPVLAAQWGYLPGFSWIVIGACLAGGVHDFVTLWASVRQDGLSLANIARREIGPVAGITTSLATMFIIVAVLASVAVVVVNALAESSWGMFTIIVTIPAAMLTGLWMYKLRPGRIGEASVIGVSIVLAGVFLGKPFAESGMSSYLLFSKPTLSIMLPVYAFIAASLPVWVLMCPRDYLSSYMKIGVMIVLAVGLIIAHPVLRMPAVTPFTAGGGPVVSGTVWPFVCIVIMCGALSGFHSLIASGTTPKMVNKERDIRPIAYGAMVVEGFVAVTALVAACALEPGDYFLINADQKNPAMHEAYVDMTARSEQDLGFNPAPVQIKMLEEETQEKLANRPGGAVTLAVGMAKVFSKLPGMSTLVAYWYHFVIMFEALFILTLLETGTRVARFVFQETLIQIRGAPAVGGKPNWLLNIGLSAATCFAWGYLLYTGNLNTLWRMLGIANQLLAVIALAVGTTYLLTHAPKRSYALLTALPLAFTLVTVMTAGTQSVMGWWAQAGKPELSSFDVFQLKLMCLLAGTMLVLTVVITLDAIRRWVQILGRPVQAGIEPA
ncbi:MAG: carbon starvation protein A [Planctomycetes bacterium]|nr:carbon starvation protein A [Planctomycetota bacterium]